MKKSFTRRGDCAVTCSQHQKSWIALYAFPIFAFSRRDRCQAYLSQVRCAEHLSHRSGVRRSPPKPCHSVTEVSK